MQDTSTSEVRADLTRSSRFRNSSDEAAFLDQLGRVSYDWSRGILFLFSAGMLVVAGLVWGSQDLVNRTILLVPLLTAVLLLALRSFATRERYQRIHQLILAHALAFSGIGLALTLGLLPPAQGVIVPVLAFFVIAAFALLPLIIAHAAIGIGVLVMACVVILLQRADWQAAGAAPDIVMLLAAYFLGVLIAFGIERRRRESYLQRRALEDRNREVAWARERTQAADRAKSEFLATMSHEIRTPINGVLGTARLLLKKGGLDGEVREALHIIERSGNVLRRHIDDALDIAAIEAGRAPLENRVFKLQQAVDAALETIRPLADEKGLALEADIAKDLPTDVVGDDGRFRQVLLNLLGNAVKFTNEGKIAITVEPVTTLPHRARIRVAVEDTGIGISDADQARIFEALTKGTDGDSGHYGGTGLGLAIAQRLVVEMGGEISVKSEVGVGTTFIFEADFMIPDADRSVIAVADEPDQSAVRPLAILLIEDDPASRYVTKGFLDLDGHEVVTAETGKSALASLTSRRFDAVVTDLQLPDISGLELLDRIRLMTEQSDIPVVVVTANILADTIEACTVRGAREIIQKPIEPERLRKALAGLKPVEGKPAVTPVATSTNAIDIPHAFDEETFTTLLEACGASRVLLLMQDFETAMQGHARDLSISLGRGNTEDAARAVHKLAGASACYGAKSVAEAARTLEQALRNGGDKDTVGRLHWELDVTLHDLAPALGLLGTALERAASPASADTDDAGQSQRTK